MNLTKDELALIRYGLDIMCRTEAQGLGQTGLNGLKEGRVDILGARLKMAAMLEVRLEEEFKHLEEIEQAERIAAEALAAAEAERAEEQAARPQRRSAATARPN